MTTSNYQRVRDFHDALGDGYPTAPTVPTSELVSLRQRLIDEEHAEVAEAVADLTGQLSEGSSLQPVDLAPLAAIIDPLAR